MNYTHTLNIVTAIKMPLSTPTKHSEKTSPTRVENRTEVSIIGREVLYK